MPSNESPDYWCSRAEWLWGNITDEEFAQICVDRHGMDPEQLWPLTLREAYKRAVHV